VALAEEGVGQPEQLAVPSDASLEIGDRDADVM
jgi:hypothetical protein